MELILLTLTQFHVSVPVSQTSEWAPQYQKLSYDLHHFKMLCLGHSYKNISYVFTMCISQF